MTFCTACNNPYLLLCITIVNHRLFALQFTLWSLNPCHTAQAGSVPGASRNEPGPAQQDQPQGSNPANLLWASSPCQNLPGQKHWDYLPKRPPGFSNSDTHD